MSKIICLGATSGIIQDIAKQYAEDKNSLILLARNAERMEVLAKDYLARGATNVFCLTGDLANYSEIESLFNKIKEDLSNSIATKESIVVVLGYGVLGNQEELQNSKNFQEIENLYRTNFLSAVKWLELFASFFESTLVAPSTSTNSSNYLAGAKISIAVISSVAGDRGRQSNYFYGSSKAALTAYLSGLRNRLAKKNISVLTIKPGFVDTAMTVNIKKGPLFASSEFVAKKIIAAINANKDSIYVPFFWKFIMLIICGIPEKIFKKLKL